MTANSGRLQSETAEKSVTKTFAAQGRSQPNTKTACSPGSRFWDSRRRQLALRFSEALLVKLAPPQAERNDIPPSQPDGSDGRSLESRTILDAQLIQPLLAHLEPTHEIVPVTRLGR